VFDTLDRIGGNADTPAGIAQSGNCFFVFVSNFFAFAELDESSREVIT